MSVYRAALAVAIMLVAAELGPARAYTTAAESLAHPDTVEGRGMGWATGHQMQIAEMCGIPTVDLSELLYKYEAKLPDAVRQAWYEQVGSGAAYTNQEHITVNSCVKTREVLPYYGHLFREALRMGRR